MWTRKQKTVTTSANFDISIGYCFVVVAHSIDEGWQRIFGHFPTANLAWEAIYHFWPMMSMDHYNGFIVIKTIKFKWCSSIWLSLSGEDTSFH